MRNIKQNTFILFLLGLMFSCNSDSSQSESNSPSFFEDILEANSGEKKEITNLLEKSYNECMQVDFSDRSNLPFYNMNLENRMVYTFFPLFITGNEKFKDGLTLNPSNISLIEMSDDEKEAKIKYDLTFDGGGKKNFVIPIEMVVKKIGDEWKLDAKEFIPLDKLKKMKDNEK